MAVSVLGALAAAPSVVHPALLAAGDEVAKKGSSASSFVPIVVIVVAGLLFVVSRRRRAGIAAAAPRSSPIVPGAVVLTRIGAIGTVIEVSDGEVLVELAPGMRVRWAPDAIASVVTPAVVDDDPADAVDTDFDPQRLPPEDRPPLP